VHRPNTGGNGKAKGRCSSTHDGVAYTKRALARKEERRGEGIARRSRDGRRGWPSRRVGDRENVRERGRASERVDEGRGRASVREQQVTGEDLLVAHLMMAIVRTIIEKNKSRKSDAND